MIKDLATTEYAVNFVTWDRWYRYDATSGGLVKAGSGKPVGRTPKRRAHADKPRSFLYKLINGKKRTVDVSRVVWILHHGPIPPGMFIDHKNRIPMDNRIENLRLATREENSKNKSSSKPFKGVTRSGTYKFAAQIRHNGWKILGPSRSTIEEAAKDYDGMADYLHGEFACKNSDLKKATV